jgi:hypothetical protein
MVNTSQNLNLSYGYLWWLNGKASFMVPGLQLVLPGSYNPDAPSDMFAALGKNGQMINIAPSQNLVYIRMGNAPGVGEVPILFNDTIWIKLKEVMCNNNSVPATGRSEIQARVYPNPAADNIKLECPGSIFDCFMFDVYGRSVFEKIGCSSSIEVPTHDWPDGSYYLRIVNENGGSFNQKIIVIK